MATPLISPGVAVSLPWGVALGAVLTSRSLLAWLALASGRLLADLASAESLAADGLAACALLADGAA